MTAERATPTRAQHVQALLLALVCSIVFLRDALLPGRALVPHPPELFDVGLAEARAEGRFDAASALRGNVGMADKYLQSLCWDRVMHDRLRAGELPRWTRDIGGGAPFVPQMAQPWQPINLLLLLLPGEQWYGWWYLLHQVAFGWFAYAFFRRLGCLHAAALVGLVAATLGLWLQCKLHHNVMLTAALGLWPMLSAVHDLAHGSPTGRGRAWSAGWLALWMGVSWGSGFIVVSLQATYLTVAFAALCLLRVEARTRLRAGAWLAAGLGLGALLSAANTVPILAAAAESARSGTFDAARLRGLGLEWDHALAALWPDLLTWGADAFYPAANGDPLLYEVRAPWSQFVLLAQPFRPDDGSAFQNWVETAWAIGLLPLAAVVHAFGDRARRGLAWFFGGAALLAFGIATADSPFLDLALVVPGLCEGDLRRLLFTAAMSATVLAALGADQQLRGGRRLPMAVLLGAVLAASAAAAAWLASAADDATFVRGVATLCAADADHPLVASRGGSVDAIAADLAHAMRPLEAANNRAMLLATALRGAVTAAIGLLALWLGRAPRAAVWIAATIAELVHAGLGPVQVVPAERVTRVPTVLQPALATAADSARPRLQRLCLGDARRTAAMPCNMPGFFGIEDGSGYNPLPPRRYEEFFTAIEPDRAGKPPVAFGGAGVGAFHDAASLAHPLCDLYGIRFVLTRDDVPTSPRLVERTGSIGGFRLLERTTTLPRATFCDQVELLPEARARLAALSRTDRDVRTTVVLEDPAAPPAQRGAAADARVALVEHRDERVVVRVATTGAGYLRLADPYGAGWRAHVDGAPAPIYVADHYLRAVPVAPGEHEVVFTYDGPSVVWPPRLSLAALLGVVALLAAGRRRSR